jgi:hypothetical protein
MTTSRSRLATAEAPDRQIRVKLTARQTNPDMGLVGKNTPLGSVLRGAVPGDTVVLRVPGRAPQSFVIQAIQRVEEAAT